MADHNSCQREQCCFSGVSYSFRLFLKNIDDKVRRTYVILLLCCFSGSVWGQDAKENSQLVKAEQLEVFADSCYNAGNISSAIESLSRSAKIRKEIQGSDNEHYSDLLSILALFYSELDNYAEAVRLGTEAMKIRKKVLGNDHRDYATSLALLAIFYSDLGNYPEAIRLCTEAMEIRKKVLGNDHRDYASSLNDLAIYYSDLGNYPEAIRLCTEAMEINKNVLGDEHPDYATSLITLAFCNSRLGNYPEAIRLCTEAMEINKNVLGDEHPDYATSLDNLAGYYSNLGNYPEAIRLCTEAMEIRKKVLGNDHRDYATSLDNLAIYYSDLGNYPEAIHLCIEAMEIRKKVLGNDHPDYATSIDNLAGYYSNLGNYPEAIRLCTEAMEIRKKVLGNDHPDYATSIDNLAGYYSNLGNYPEAIRLCTEAMEIRKKVLGNDHPDYATSLSNLAIYYSNLGNYPEAIRLCTEAMEIRKKVLGNDHPDYASSLNNLAVYYSDLGNYPEAIRLCTEAMEILKKVLGNDHPDYASSLRNLAIYNNKLGNHPCAYILSSNSISYSQSTILNSFAELSSELQEALWNKKGNAYSFCCLFPSFVYRYQTRESVSELYDKTALFAKGILQNSCISMRKLILESNDPMLLSKYDELTTNVSIYNKLIEKPFMERCLDTDSLRSIIHQQGMELARESKAYGDYAKNLRINWKDVQQCLSNNDIAIEFLSFPVSEDSVMYVALTLKKGSDVPQMTPLFDERQLKQVLDTLYFQCADMTDLVWKPLQSELQGVRNIYFSPSGTLYNIGIEYLPGMENYNIYRLSSTRELVTRKNTESDNRAVLYGGLDYYANFDKKSNTSSLIEEYVEHVDVRGMKLRGGKEHLPQTKVEVEKISEELSNAKWIYQLFTDKDGTEESFKALSGKKIINIHISTHGFYYTPDEVESIGYKFLQLDDQFSSAEDKSLTRSGLIMSGANHILEGEEIPDNVEDGILTAKEIANVDLRGLDLVVLSACQTGLGDISQGEGVFGLQRGFKKAGANTILMSLWEVNDEATQILMTQFYRNLLSGQTKRQSLLSAQKYLREYNNGQYNEPKYWAAFILLDAIN